jgi:DNA-directed RNA polymerase beta subunit
LHRKIRGTVRLFDTNTGQKIDENDMTLMKVPFLTERGTFVHNGSEYTTMNQARLLHGVYVRRKATGELEGHFNVKRGTGNSFRIHLEPESGLFKMEIGQASLRLYSLLHDLGIPDEKLEATWGPDLLKQNRDKYDARVFDKAYARLVKRPDPKATREDKAKAIQAALGSSMLSRHVLERTLPNRFNKMAMASPPAPLVPAGDIQGKQEQSDDFNHSDYLLLAKFLDDKFHAGIPLTLPTAELVAMITQKLHELEPNVNAAMLELSNAPGSGLNQP